MIDDLDGNIVRLRGEIADLRSLIGQATNLHPESENVVDAIAGKLDTELDDRLDDSLEQTKQNQIAFLERALANLRERARALIRRRPETEGLFEGKLWQTGASNAARIT